MISFVRSWKEDKGYVWDKAEVASRDLPAECGKRLKKTCLIFSGFFRKTSAAVDVTEVQFSPRCKNSVCLSQHSFLVWAQVDDAV